MHHTYLKTQRLTEEIQMMYTQSQRSPNMLERYVTEAARPQRGRDTGPWSSNGCLGFRRMSKCSVQSKMPWAATEGCSAWGISPIAMCDRPSSLSTWLSVGAFPERFNQGWGTHSECEWCHAMSCGSKHNEKALFVSHLPRCEQFTYHTCPVKMDHCLQP